MDVYHNVWIICDFDNEKMCCHLDIPQSFACSDNLIFVSTVLKLSCVSSATAETKKSWKMFSNSKKNVFLQRIAFTFFSISVPCSHRTTSAAEESWEGMALWSKVKILWLSLCCVSCVKTMWWICTFSRWGGESASKKTKAYSTGGLNYVNPIIVINCWENSALIAPKQQVQLYTALMWILGNQLVHFHMKECILCLEGELGEVMLFFFTETTVCLSDAEIIKLHWKQRSVTNPDTKLYILLESEHPSLAKDG